jgi:HD superfamily phosphohydrolase
VDRFEARRISDPVHGTIGLSELEVRVLSTQAFQRLKNVKQLGLVYQVFPGADYSRFAHSIGVCHITGKILAALSRRYPTKISEDEIQRYRLAALLHDVGHYPFSHTLEHAIKDHYSSSLFADGPGGGGAPKTSFKHERASREVVNQDSEIASVLAGHEPARITAIFMREEPPAFANLVSSDLDADRIDYLLRTAHHTGLPYGSVDLEYIISQMRVDEQGRVCLSSKAVRAADHFLLSRFFDYQQITYHKTVAALEWALSDVLTKMLQADILELSADDVTAMIQDGSWRTFDDAHVIGLIREHREVLGEIVRRKIDAVLHRHPPKLLVETEYIAARGETEQKQFRLLHRMVRDRVPEFASKSGIDLAHWHLWTRPGIVLTKIGSTVPVTSAIEPDKEDEEAYEQMVRILDATETKSAPIVDLQHSLMRPLAEQALYVLRLYVLPPADDVALISGLRNTIKKDLPDVSWK